MKMNGAVLWAPNEDWSVEEIDLDVNDSAYGLGGTVFTRDAERGRAVADKVKTGTIGINRYAIPLDAPFGGVKASGLGRELGPEGLAAYQHVKAIYS